MKMITLESCDQEAEDIHCLLVWTNDKRVFSIYNVGFFFDYEESVPIAHIVKLKNYSNQNQITGEWTMEPSWFHTNRSFIVPSSWGEVEFKKWLVERLELKSLEVVVQKKRPTTHTTKFIEAATGMYEVSVNDIEFDIADARKLAEGDENEQHSI